MRDINKTIGIAMRHKYAMEDEFHFAIGRLAVAKELNSDFEVEEAIFELITSLEGNIRELKKELDFVEKWRLGL